MIYELICAFLLLISLLSLATAVVIYLEFKKRLERAKKAPAPTLDAQDILQDLMSDRRTVLKIERISPEDIFLRSPRGL